MPTTITNFQEAHEVLARFVPTAGAAKAYTLERIQALMNFLGNPQEKIKVVHVAGTSGKTSTCYYIASLLQAAGHKVGLTVSPHVSEVNERLQINLEPLPEAKFCRELSEFLQLIEKSNIQPTYFELLVAFAYWEFAKRRVNYVVVEVGLGGLLDGTNVVERTDKICVITDIGLDHVNVLGHTLAEIAAQKAGIIQNENVVFSYKQAPEIANVLAERCQEQNATLNLIESKKLPAEFGFLPLFQQHNFVLAQSVTEYVLEHDHHMKFNAQQLLQAAAVRIPARMEIFVRGDKTIILDGAHNAQKLHALTASVRVKFPDKPVAALLGFAANREYRLESSIHEIISVAHHIIVTRFQTGQDLLHKSVDPAAIIELLRQENFYEAEATTDMHQALHELLARPEPVLLITGSFYLLYHIRPLLLELGHD